MTQSKPDGGRIWKPSMGETSENGVHYFIFDDLFFFFAHTIDTINVSRITQMPRLHNRIRSGSVPDNVGRF